MAAIGELMRYANKLLYTQRRAAGMISREGREGRQGGRGVLPSDFASMTNGMRYGLTVDSCPRTKDQLIARPPLEFAGLRNLQLPSHPCRRSAISGAQATRCWPPDQYSRAH